MSNDRYGLSDREIEVLRLLSAEGHPTKRIATQFGITDHTVKNHRAVIRRKLGAKNQVQMAYLAAKRGLV